MHAMIIGHSEYMFYEVWKINTENRPATVEFAFCVKLPGCLSSSSYQACKMWYKQCYSYAVLCSIILFFFKEKHMLLIALCLLIKIYMTIFSVCTSMCVRYIYTQVEGREKFQVSFLRSFYPLLLRQNFSHYLEFASQLIWIVNSRDLFHLPQPLRLWDGIVLLNLFVSEWTLDIRLRS